MGVATTKIIAWCEIQKGYEPFAQRPRVIFIKILLQFTLNLLSQVWLFIGVLLYKRVVFIISKHNGQAISAANRDDHSWGPSPPGTSCNNKKDQNEMNLKITSKWFGMHRSHKYFSILVDCLYARRYKECLLWSMWESFSWSCINIKYTQGL